ncbi:MAG: methyl-accepting chemotaxis protein [Rhodocyclaceae bacterium]|nr:methyl-accepting chemotaxis protein [Rhodocyclaceae bacterium]
MLNQLTIRIRLFLTAAISVALTTVIGFVGYQGLARLSEANQASAVYAKAIRYQVEVDMFHDGLASVVHAALIAGLRSDQELYARARTDLEEQAKAMQEDIDIVAGLPLSPDVQAKVDAALQPIAAYIAGARRLVGLAYEHNDEAFQNKAEFDRLFDRLEVELEALGDTMLARTQAAEQSATAAADTKQTAMLAVLAVTIPALLIVAIFSASSIGGRIDALSNFAADIAAGDADLTKRLPESGADEVTRTAREFNRFLSSLEALVRDTKSEALQVAGTAKELDQHATGLSQGAEAQNEAAESTAATIEELSVSIGAIADSAEHVRTLALSSLERTRAGRASLDELTSEVESVARAVAEMSDSAKEFIRSTGTISRMTQQVREIAEQTNLLALNAAIEAARAGEQGRGFAVVADEVRKLAERSATAVGEIDQVTQDLATRSKQVEQAIEKGQVAIESGRQSTAQVLETLAAADEAVNESTNGIDEISRSVTEQRSASQDIANSVERIARMSDQGQASVQATGQAANRLSSSAANLAGLVARFRTA